MSTMARALAQESVSWYFSHADAHLPHPTNVQNHLRGPVIAITKSILEPDVDDSPAPGKNGSSPSTNDLLESGSGKMHAQDDNKKKAAGANWRDYLDGKGNSPKSATAEFGRVSKDIYEKFGRRTKARLEAFLAGVALAVPPADRAPAQVAAPATYSEKKNDLPKKKPVSAAQGLTIAEGLATPSATSNDSTPPPMSPLNAIGRQSLVRAISGNQTVQRKLPQITEEELVIRFELYIRCLHRAKTQGQECVVAAEPAPALKARARSIVISFVDSVGTVRQQSPVLTRLLNYLTMELLAVDVLGEDLVRVIHRLVSDYEHCTSFASLAFLSSPENSAEQRLTPMILKYLRYLQSNWKNCEAECELERMLSLSLDSKLRTTFKTIEFHSIGHLLEICHGFRKELQHIELAPGVSCGEANVEDEAAVRQAIRDLRRELITVNGHVLPPVTSRSDLIELLSQTLNSRTLMGIKPKSRRRARKAAIRRSESDPIVTASSSDTSDCSGNEADMSGGEKLPLERISRRRNFHLSTVDLLTKRLLLAACRTGTGGDAYFVVRDLFGGDDVEVVPSQVFPSDGRAVRPTIEILVRLASVTIKCHGSFDVYPKSLMGDVEPLIQIHTTTTETISLQEVRAGDSHSNSIAKEDEYSTTDSEAVPSATKSVHVMVVQERETERTGWRMLSVRPALYQKVEDWRTPS